jgi:hypothetical protein
MTGKRRTYLRMDAALWVMSREIPSLGKIQLDSFLGYRVNPGYIISCHVQVNPNLNYRTVYRIWKTN